MQNPIGKPEKDLRISLEEIDLFEGRVRENISQIEDN